MPREDLCVRLTDDLDFSIVAGVLCLVQWGPWGSRNYVPLWVA